MRTRSHETLEDTADECHRQRIATHRTTKATSGVNPRTAILIAAGVYFVVSAWVPLGSTILYPLTLFTTWVHEMGHGLTALVCGGSFLELEIHANAGGLARAGAADGWPDALVAAGGLLAPPFLGAVILATVHGPRRARWFLGGLALAIAASLILYVRSGVGIIAMSAVAVLLGYVASRGFREKPERRVWFAQFLAVILAVDTLTRMVSYAFKRKIAAGTSDVGHITENLGGHYLLWGSVITVLALGMLAFGVWWAWRPRRRAAQASR